MAQDFLNKTRQEYSKGSLSELSCPKDPLELFSNWFDDAGRYCDFEPNYMTLSTSSPSGQVHSRIVLLKQFDSHGFVFFSNYNSRKGSEIAHNPRVSIQFFWHTLERVVRIEGIVHKSSPSDSDAYFKTRPRESQVAAWASEQSQKIQNRQELEDRYAAYEAKFKDQAVPRPENWGGYLLIPDYYEFWQGGTKRLHDRIAYERDEAIWVMARLSP